MERLRRGAGGAVRPLVALAIVIGLYHLAKQPEPGTDERAELAAPYRFARSALPELAGTPQRSLREVHPSYRKIVSWISAVGGAVALNDVDGDGLPNDACWVETRADQVVVAPVPGTGARYAAFALEPVPHPAPATIAPMGCLPGDFNEDGWLDLLVYYWGRPPVAYLRRAAAALPGPAAYRAWELTDGGERWNSNAAAQADVDGDGHLDLVIGNYFPDGARVLDPSGPGVEFMHASMSRASNGGRNRLLLWSAATGGSDPSVRYREQRLSAIGFDRSWTLGVGAASLDDDLLPELYFANDFGPDRLLHNESAPGRVRFTLLNGERTLRTPSSKVLGRDSFKGMGVDFGDLNGDGLQDLYVSNIAQEYALEESHFVWVSTGEVERMRDGVAPYADRSEPLGLARSSWGWDTRLDDFDNDGVLEAVQAIGFLRGRVDRWPLLHELAMGSDFFVASVGAWPRLQPGDDLSGHRANAFFVRSPSGRYFDVAKEVGFGDVQLTRGLATADVDGDGRLDLAVGNQWERSNFYRNEARDPGAFLGLRVLLPVGGEGALEVWPGRPPAAGVARAAVGAVGTVLLPDGRRIVRFVDGGNGHSGKRSPELMFGLGDLDPQASLPVELRWRDERGAERRTSLLLSPGWHTVLLGAAAGEG